MSHALQYVVLTMAGWLNHRQQDQIYYLRGENRILREQLGDRPLRLIVNERVERYHHERNHQGLVHSGENPQGPLEIIGQKANQNPGLDRLMLGCHEQQREWRLDHSRGSVRTDGSTERKFQGSRNLNYWVITESAERRGRRLSSSLAVESFCR